MSDLFLNAVIIGAICLLIGLFIGFSVGFMQRVKRQNSGETTVRNMLIKTFPNKDYHLMNDITIPLEDGSTQVDHILVSQKGVFIIETKNYSGWIFGNSDNPYWTQVIFQFRSKFQNPIHQNYKHLLVIRKLLDFLPLTAIIPIVVFTGEAEFKTDKPQGVYYLSELVDAISSYNQELMSENRMQFCVGRIETIRKQISLKTDIEHQIYLDRKYGVKH